MSEGFIDAFYSHLDVTPRGVSERITVVIDPIGWGGTPDRVKFKNSVKLKYAPIFVMCTRLNRHGLTVKFKNSVKLKYAPDSLPICTQNGRQVLY